jgi:photosystem II stability/assembly factor-like uncharacterized protein
MSKNIIEKMGIVPMILAVLFLVLFAGIFANGGNDDDTSKLEKDSLILRDAHGLAVDIENPDQLYIANHSGVYGLDSTGELSAINEVEADFMSFATHPTDPNIMFSSGHPTTGGNLGFQKSDDGGKTWEKVSDGLNGPVDFHTLAVDQANPDVIYGYYSGQLQRSIDGGSNWQYVDIPGNIIQLATGPNEGSVYAATASGLYVSDDQAETWSPIDTFTGIAISVAVNPEDKNEIAIFTEADGLQKSIDGGQSWQAISTPLRSERIFFIAYSKSSPEVMYILSEKLNVLMSNDSGASWQQYN